VAGDGYHQIKVFNIATQTLVATLIGHGDVSYSITVRAQHEA
jgi:hypothetical protein